MNKTFLIYKTLKKCAKTTKDENNGKSSSVDAGLIITIILLAILAAVLIVLGYVLGPFAEFLGGSVKIIEALGIVCGSIIIIRSVMKLVTALYLSSDIDMLITMPLSAIQIATVRLADALARAYKIAFFVFVPFLTGYMITGVIDAKFVLALVLMFIGVPLFMTVSIAVLLILIFSVFKIIRNKDFLKIIGIVCGIVAYFLYIYVSNHIPDGGVEQSAQAVITVFDKIRFLVPIIPFLVKFVGGEGVINLIIAISLTVLVCVLFAVVVNRFYLSGALSIMETSGKSKRLDATSLTKVTRKSSPVKALRTKDFRIVRRTPAYLLNNLITIFAWPLIFVFISILQGNSGSFTQVFKSMIQNAAGMSNEFDFAVNMVAMSICLLCILEITAFSGLMSQIGSRCISREGADFVFMKQIPIPYKVQLKAKKSLAMRVMATSTYIYSALFFALFVYMKIIPWYAAVFAVVLVVAGMNIVVNRAIYNDLKMPNLNWENEARMAKGPSSGGMWYLLYIILFAIPAVAAIILPFIKMTAVSLIVWIVYTVVMVLFAVISGKRMYRFGEKKLSEL